MLPLSWPLHSNETYLHHFYNLSHVSPPPLSPGYFLSSQQSVEVCAVFPTSTSEDHNNGPYLNLYPSTVVLKIYIPLS